MAEVIVRPGAEADIREAALWYESRRPGLGGDFTLRLDALLERIVHAPLQFPEIGSGVRRAVLQRFPYAIYFVVAATPVVVLLSTRPLFILNTCSGANALRSNCTNHGFSPSPEIAIESIRNFAPD
jgi:toxin ParE1/3/4